MANVGPEDIAQGDLGNCWILAAISSLAETAGRIDNFFINTSKSCEGIYGVNMYVLGVPYTMWVDDYLPLQGNDLAFVGKGKDSKFGFWASILEKAFAKRYGNYAHSIGGAPPHAITNLNGSPFT